LQHSANSDFWREYERLPVEIRVRADKQFALLKSNPEHPSLQFKKVGVCQTVRRSGQRAPLSAIVRWP